MRKKLLIVLLSAMGLLLGAPSTAFGDGPFDFAVGAGTRPFGAGFPGFERHFAFSIVSVIIFSSTHAR